MLCPYCDAQVSPSATECYCCHARLGVRFDTEEKPSRPAQNTGSMPIHNPYNTDNGPSRNSTGASRPQSRTPARRPSAGSRSSGTAKERLYRNIIIALALTLVLTIIISSCSYNRLKKSIAGGTEKSPEVTQSAPEAAGNLPTDPVSLYLASIAGSDAASLRACCPDEFWKMYADENAAFLSANFPDAGIDGYIAKLAQDQHDTYNAKYGEGFSATCEKVSETSGDTEVHNLKIANERLKAVFTDGASLTDCKQLKVKTTIRDAAGSPVDAFESAYTVYLHSNGSWYLLFI